MIILETQDLTKEFMGLKALTGVNLKINKGEIFGLIGPNGSGKTTCFNLITGFLKPTSGNILFAEKSVRGLAPFEIAKRGIVRTFQLVSLFPNLSCEENVIIGMHLKLMKSGLGEKLFWWKRRDVKLSALRTKAKEILRLMGMEGFLNMPAKNLPLGDERRLALAVALATDPKVLLLDEPAAGMSPRECVHLLQLIREIQKKGITVLIVEHNMRVVMEICDRIAVLNYGEKIAEGIPKEIAENKQVISVYLGESKK
jgi:branched-chain amino acid transport system ATP-binding protein